MIRGRRVLDQSESAIFLTRLDFGLVLGQCVFCNYSHIQFTDLDSPCYCEDPRFRSQYLRRPQLILALFSTLQPIAKIFRSTPRVSSSSSMRPFPTTTYILRLQFYHQLNLDCIYCKQISFLQRTNLHPLLLTC